MPTIPLPILPDVYRTTLNWTDGPSGQIAANVIHLYAPGLTETNVYNNFVTAKARAMWAGVSSGAHITTIDVLKLDGSSPTFTNATGAPAAFAGNGGGDPIPQAAAIVKLRTAYRGRANRGRIYLPFIGETSQAAGTLDATQQGDGQTAWSTFLTAVAALGVSLVVASYDRAHSGTGAHWHYVTSVVVESKLGTQRKRQERNR